MSDSARAFDSRTARRIAERYLPSRWSPDRWHYHYARIKLASDPLYPAVVAALRNSPAPLLDLGCGPGLLAQALREQQVDIAYSGVDVDQRKIAVAQAAARRASLHDVRFEVLDLAAAFPDHRGSVALLDVLQYLPLDGQRRLLDAAIAMLAPGARLVIRSGIDDGGRNIRITRAFDRAANLLGWMGTRPQRYPRRDEFESALHTAGLQAQITPLAGNTPFNNFLIVATR